MTVKELITAAIGHKSWFTNAQLKEVEKWANAVVETNINVDDMKTKIRFSKSQGNRKMVKTAYWGTYAQITCAEAVNGKIICDGLYHWCYCAGANPGFYRIESKVSEMITNTLVWMFDKKRAIEEFKTRVREIYKSAKRGKIKLVIIRCYESGSATAPEDYTLLREATDELVAEGLTDLYVYCYSKQYEWLINLPYLDNRHFRIRVSETSTRDPERPYLEALLAKYPYKWYGVRFKDDSLTPQRVKDLAASGKKGRECPCHDGCHACGHKCVFMGDDIWVDEI